MTCGLALFDFDGVLADSAGWFVAQLPELAKRHGFRAPDAAEIDRLRRLPTRAVVRALGVSPWRLPGIASDLRRRMAADAAQIALFDGAAPMLERLHAAGVEIAIVSSNSEANVRAVLGVSASRVSAFSCGASLFGKSGHFTALLRKRGVAPALACAVGDEVRDIEAARRAGIAAVAVAWGYSAKGALSAAAPDHIAESPAELVEFLLAWPGR